MSALTDSLSYTGLDTLSERALRRLTDGWTGELYVPEEVGEVLNIGKKVVRINNLLTENNVIEDLRKLKNGDHIYCYVKESSSYYEVVQIKGDSMILSLEQYKQIMHKQSISGFIIFPIVFCLSTGIGVCSIIAVFKNKKQVQL